MKSPIEIKTTKKYGRGLYATKNIKEGQVVEVSPVIVVDHDDREVITTTQLNIYVFSWTYKKSALALGNGSLFNHSRNSNVTYKNSVKAKQIEFTALRNIKKGEQLFINYGYEPAHGIEVTKRNKARLRPQGAVEEFETIRYI